MAKTIKFNLIIDKQAIRDMEDLREYFNVNDLLIAFHNGSLNRWLAARELSEELEKLSAIKGDDAHIAAELCKALQANCTPEQAAAAVYPFEFRQKELADLKQYHAMKDATKAVIKNYHDGYDGLLDRMEGSGEDYPFLKAAVAELFEKYVGLFKLNDLDFYDRFISQNPLVILTMLANQDTRTILPHSVEEIHKQITVIDLTSASYVYDQQKLKLFLEQWKLNKQLPEVKRCENTDLVALKSAGRDILMLECINYPSMNEHIVTMKELLPSYCPFTYVYPTDIGTVASPRHVKSFAGATEGYWKDLEPKGKRFMLINMVDGNIVRNSGKQGEELKAADVNGKFPLLDGIDYKSNNAGHSLVYMEV